MSNSRSMTILNEMGDLELSWDSQHDDKMIPFIQSRIDAGVTFFVLKPLIGNYLHRRSKIKNVDEIKKRQVFLNDEHIENVLSQEYAFVSRKGTDQRYVSERRAKNALDVAQNNTVGVRPMTGG